MASARQRRHSGGDGLRSAAALVAVTQVCPVSTVTALQWHANRVGFALLFLK